MDPEDWEKRFHENTKKPTLQQCIHKRESRQSPEKSLILKKKAAKARELSEKFDSDMKRSEKDSTNDKETDTSVQSPEMDDEEISQVQSKKLHPCFNYKYIFICAHSMLLRQTNVIFYRPPSAVLHPRVRLFPYEAAQL